MEKHWSEIIGFVEKKYKVKIHTLKFMTKDGLAVEEVHKKTWSKFKKDLTLSTKEK